MSEGEPEFGGELRRLRSAAGLSLRGLAARVHYSKGYLSKIETGSKRATIDVAHRCDQILGVEGELLRLLLNTKLDSILITRLVTHSYRD